MVDRPHQPISYITLIAGLLHGHLLVVFYGCVYFLVRDVTLFESGQVQDQVVGESVQVGLFLEVCLAFALLTCQVGNYLSVQLFLKQLFETDLGVGGEVTETG